jgi:hypothetical protein
MRRGRWLSAEVSEINLRNSALNHMTRGVFIVFCTSPFEPVG